jgi:uncharacterized protein with FMN-binding domain
MQSTYERQSKIKLITTIMTIIVIAGAVLIIDHLKSEDNATAKSESSLTASQTSETTNVSTSTAAETSQTTSADSSSTYKDGTYTATSQYYVPHGNESITVTLTLKDGTITDSSIENSGGDHDSKAYQKDFTSAYKKYVVGKKINGLKLGVVSGASDTSQGFNDALAEISSKAQS